MKLMRYFTLAALAALVGLDSSRRSSMEDGKVSLQPARGSIDLLPLGAVGDVGK